MCPEARGAEALAGWEVVCLLASWCGCYRCVCVVSRVGVARGLGARRAMVEEERSLVARSFGEQVPSAAGAGAGAAGAAGSAAAGGGGVEYI